MKKIAYLALAAVTLGAASSCGNCDKAACTDNGFEKYYTQADCDSLVSALAYAMGLDEKADKNQLMAVDSTFSIDTYLKGIQYIMVADTTSSFVQGMMTGVNFRRQIANMQRAGINVNDGLLINEYKRAMLSDTLTQEMQQTAYNDYQKQYEKYARLKQSYDSLQLATSEESLANIEKGKEYMAKVTAEDAEVVLDNSGIAYKISEAGDAAKVKGTDKVKLNMTAKNIDGRTIRALNDSREMSVADLEEGLGIGVQMLGKGGKGVFYVPGRLAYGIAQRQNNVGPNELIIYEVEVVDIIPAE